jgi:hypothetical protein
MATITCRRETLVGFLQDQLEEDDRLDFLIHLDACPNCWEAVYSATKAAHAHFYKRPINTARFADIDLSGLEMSDDESEEVFEVA